MGQLGSIRNKYMHVRSERSLGMRNRVNIRGDIEGCTDQVRRRVKVVLEMISKRVERPS